MKWIRRLAIAMQLLSGTVSIVIGVAVLSGKMAGKENLFYICLGVCTFCTVFSVALTQMEIRKIRHSMEVSDAAKEGQEQWQKK